MPSGVVVIRRDGSDGPEVAFQPGTKCTIGRDVKNTIRVNIDGVPETAVQITQSETEPQAHVAVASDDATAILINGFEVRQRDTVLTDGDVLSVVGRKFRYFFRHPKEVKVLRLEVERLEEKLLAASALNVSLTAKLNAKDEEYRELVEELRAAREASKAAEMMTAELSERAVVLQKAEADARAELEALAVQLEATSATISSLQGRVAEFEENTVTGDARVAELEDMIAQSKADAEAEKMELMELSDAERKNTLIALEEKTQTLILAQARISELETQIAEANDNSLKARLAGLTSEMDLLQQSLAESRDNEDNLILELESTQQELARMMESHPTKGLEAADSNGKDIDLQGEASQVEAKIAKLEVDLVAKEEELSEVQLLYDGLVEEKRGLQDKVNALGVEKTSAQELEGKLATVEALLAKECAENQILRAKLQGYDVARGDSEDTVSSDARERSANESTKQADATLNVSDENKENGRGATQKPTIGQDVGPVTLKDSNSKAGTSNPLRKSEVRETDSRHVQPKNDTPSTGEAASVTEQATKTEPGSNSVDKVERDGKQRDKQPACSCVIS
mmetsp:Transcript_9791/g.35869  ORF Transcript_9791/g.35869 Transcript_9791/m.35869 type:complete len:571 (-) Transcript_9791:58-1770(-)